MSETIEHSLLLNKLLIESMSDGLLCIDQNLRCTLINTSALKILGYAEEYCVGRNIHDFIQIRQENGEPCPTGQCVICKAVNNKIGCVVEDGRFWKADGNLINLRYTTHPIIANGEVIGAAILFSDTSSSISQNESQNELENIFNQSMDVICVIDHEGKFRKINNACERMWGYKADDLVGKSYFDLVDHEGLAQIKKTVIDLMKRRDDACFFENNMVCKNGSLISMTWSARWDKTQKLMYCIARDATDKKLAEKKLIQSEAFLEEAQRFAKMGNWSYDFETDEITWSKELYNIFGVDINIPAKTHGSFVKLIDEEDRQMASYASKHTQETGESFNIQYRITTPGGEKRVIEEFGYGEANSSGQVARLFGTAQDITERKRAEDKIKEIAWIQSHIVRVPVTRIIGLISLIKDKHVDESEMEKTLDYIMVSAKQLDHITKDISDKTIHLRTW
jgi:PAS domain S-box-containing protein